MARILRRRRLKSKGERSAHEYDFFQIIDKLERTPPEEAEKKLAALGFSLADVKQFIESGKPTAELQSILDNLAARGLRDFVKVDYHVIRGLAYYTGVVFEAFDAKGEFRAIAGGGRYDNLVKLISGGKVDLPALGFGMGDVVLLELLKARGLLPKFDSTTDVFVLIEDETLRPQSLETRPGFARRRICRGISAHAGQAGQAIQTRAGIEGGEHRAHWKTAITSASAI